MTTSLLSLKQELAKLSENERREVSAYLIRLGQESAEWKEEAARRLERMSKGESTSTTELRNRLGHAG